MAGERLTAIRLPLQIGTSALWSIARSSAFFPGIVLVGLGVYTLVELWDLDKVGFALAGAIAFTGGALVYYAFRHAWLAMRERPSDVLLDERGLMVRGGRRDGLAIAWADIDPERCAVENAVETRFVLWRVLVNVPLLALSIAAEEGILIDFSQKIPIKRLYVARRGHDQRILFAEGDLPVEMESLQTLIATIRSSRWREKKQKKKHAPAADVPQAILCGNCGAPVAPQAMPQVACAFCNHAVPIPPDVRERVAAAENLARGRSRGFARMSRLLESQPSAERAMTAITVATIPIVLAWPVAGILAFRSYEASAAGAQSLLGLMAFPILLTFAAFLLARATMTDRFALHAVVIGFGAREPARPGEPYRCRACEAALPPAQGSPIVRCVYCHQESVLGLDLRADAHEAERETRSIDEAFASRTRERWFWGFGSVVAFGLLALAWLSVRPSIHGRVVPPAELHARTAFASPKHYDSGAPKFKNVGLAARLDTSSGTLPFTPSSCELFLAPSGIYTKPCRARFVCNGETVFGGEEPASCDMDGSKVRTYSSFGAMSADASIAKGTLEIKSPVGEKPSYSARFSLTR